VVLFIGYASWELAFVPIAIALGVLIVMTSLTTRMPYEAGQPRLDPLATLRSVADTRSAVVLIVTASIATIVWQGATTFLPTFLHNSKAYSTVQAAYLFATLFGVGILATPTAGYLGDRFGYLKVGILSTVTGSAGIVLLTQARTHFAVLGSIVLFAIGLTSFWPLLWTYLTKQFTQARIGASLGILRTIFFAVGSLGPVLVGVVAESFGYEASFWLLGILFAGSAVGLVCTLFV
jgi:MFS family permease